MRLGGLYDLYAAIWLPPNWRLVFVPCGRDCTRQASIAERRGHDQSAMRCLPSYPADVFLDWWWRRWGVDCGAWWRPRCDAGNPVTRRDCGVREVALNSCRAICYRGRSAEAACLASIVPPAVAVTRCIEGARPAWAATRHGGPGYVCHDRDRGRPRRGNRVSAAELAIVVVALRAEFSRCNKGSNRNLCTPNAPDE